MDTSKITLLTKLFLSLAIISLAASIAYFSYALITVNKQLPEVLKQINASSQNVSAIVEVVDTITTQIPTVLAEVHQLREQLRQQIPPILNEVAAVRKQVPIVLEEAEAIRQQIPVISKEVAALSQQIPIILDEMAAYRALMPKVLTEVATVRETIPPTLDRLDLLVYKADEISNNIGHNTVQNVFSGIIKAPFNMVQNFSSGLFPGKKISAADKQMIIDLSLKLLNSGEINQSLPIKSDTSTLNGEVKLVAEKTIDEQYCRLIKVTLKNIGEDVETVCRDQEGRWKMQNLDD